MAGPATTLNGRVRANGASRQRAARTEPAFVRWLVIGTALAFLASSVHRLGELMPAVENATDVDGLHQFRVELRRVRALLQAFDGALPADDAGALVEECRWLARASSVVRDCDTFLQRLPEYVGPAAGADAVAMISALVRTPDPATAVRTALAHLSP